MTVELEHQTALEDGRSTSQTRSAWSRLAQDKLALTGLAVLIIIVLLIATAPLTARHDPVEINRRDQESRIKS